MKTLSNAFLGAMFVMLTSFATVASAAGTVSTTVNADTMFTSVEQVEAVANKVNEAQGATDAESLEATEDFINLLRATGLPATGSYSPSHINADSEIDLVAKMFLVCCITVMLIPMVISRSMICRVLSWLCLFPSKTPWVPTLVNGLLLLPGTYND